MKNYFTTTLAAVLCASVACAAQPAKEPTLKVGDPAPRLQASKWVKGGPINELEKGKVYVMEFWATWCGPCRVAIPHVTELQAKYKDKGVIVIGMNIWERDLKLVEPFVKEMGEKMEYAVAMETKEGEKGLMAETWMAAAGRNGIPCSFIVDREGKIAWIGHPMSMDGPLAKVVAGTFDAAKQAEIDKKIEDLQEQIGPAAQAKDYDKVLKILDELVSLDPGMGKMVGSLKLRMLILKEDYAGANAAAAKLLDEAGNEAIPLIQLAMTMTQAPAAEKLDGDLMLKIAQKAVDVGGEYQKYAKAALAKAYALKKQYDKAVAIQTEVVAELTGPEKQSQQKVLEEYQKQAEKK